MKAKYNENFQIALSNDPVFNNIIYLCDSCFPGELDQDVTQERYQTNLCT